MWSARQTRTGRIVYARKRHPFRPADLLRIAVRTPIGGEQDAGIISAALVFLELKLEEFTGISGGCQNLAEIWPIWYKKLKALSTTTWATWYRQLWPLEAETLAIVLTGWEGFGAIRTTQQIAAAALQAALDTANARISQLERENQALRDQLYG